MATKKVKISGFKGFISSTDPMSLGNRWLVNVDNMNITDAGNLETMEGYSKKYTGLIYGSYGTIDKQRLFLIDSGSLKKMGGGLINNQVLQSGLVNADYSWAEINNEVYFNNGTQDGIIKQDNSVIPIRFSIPSQPSVFVGTGRMPAGQYQVCTTFILADGRETGASNVAAIDLKEAGGLTISNIDLRPDAATLVYIQPANSTVFQLAFEATSDTMSFNGTPDDLGMDLTTQFCYPMPEGCSKIEFHKGQLYAAQYFAEQNSTVIWYSQPLGFHLFKTMSDFITIKGRLTDMKSHPLGLVICTDEQILTYNGESLNVEAEFGTPNGYPIVADERSNLLIWTNRGLCRALPFEMITDEYVSVAAGLRVGAALVEKDGAKRFVVAIRKGGSAYNSR